MNDISSAKAHNSDKNALENKNGLYSSPFDS